MSNRAFSVAFALTVIGAAGCANNPDPTPSPAPEDCTDPAKAGCLVSSTKQRVMSPNVPDADLKAAVAGNTAFAIDLYQQLRTQPGNLFYSPYSISSALAMTWAGARNETEKQMAKALHFDLPQVELHPAFNAIDLQLASRGAGAMGKDGQGFRLRVANALWGQMGFDFVPAFLDTLAESYGAGMHVVDFVGSPDPSRTIINDWVAAHTEDRIKDLLPPGSVSGDTRLVLTNAVYFNAAWATPFDAKNTKATSFTRGDGSTVQADTMSGVQEIPYGEGDGYAAIRLPYDGGELSMVLILPAAGGLDAFEASLTPSRLDAITSGMSQHSVTLTLPKFKIEASFGLVDQLGKLGMPIAFTDEADFTGIHAKGGLSISDVVHKAFVDVSETGTEAAAATGVVIGVTSIPQPAEIHFDHPFLLLIRDEKTGTILFVGRVGDPTK